MVSGLRRLLGIRLGVLRQYSPVPLSVVNESALSQEECGSWLPRISVVTPSFNQGEYIGRTVQSVLDQNYPNFEYIIQDGASNDSTLDALAAFPAGLFTIVSEQDGGQADAINRGFSCCNGEIMGWLNSDDILLPGALLRIGRYFYENPNVDVIYGDRVIIDEFDRDIGRWDLPGHSDDVLRVIDYVPQEALYWRRSLWVRAGGYVDAGLSFAMDWELLLRFQAAGARFTHLPIPLGAFRVHQLQKTSALMKTQGQKEIAVLRRQYGGGLSKWRGMIYHVAYLLRHMQS